MGQRECFVSEEELYLYVDGELGIDRKAELASHLNLCGECAARYGIAAKLKATVKESCSSASAPSWLHNRILSLIEEEASIKDTGFWEFLKNIMSRKPLIPVGAAGLLVIVFMVALFSNAPSHGNMPFVSWLIGEHNEYQADLENFDIRSSDPDEITHWLTANTGMRIAIPSDTGTLSPGGACVLKKDGEDTGYVFFDYSDKRISMFMLKDKHEKLFGQREMTVKNVSMYCGSCTGMNYVLWKRNDIVCVLVGDIPEDSLTRLAGQFI